MSLFNLFKKIEPQQPKQKIDFDSTFFNMKIKELPLNFAQKVMDLQMKLQFAETYELNTIRQLNDLYKLAIEYYIHQDSKKANHFQKRLTNLLSNKQTLEVIQKTSSPNQQKAKLQQQYQKQLNNQLGHFNIQSNVMVEQIIVGSHRKIEKNNRLIHQQLNNQESLLNQRLEKRSKSKNHMRKYHSP